MYLNQLLKRVKEYQGTTTYWEATSTDAYGHIQNESFGNGVLTFTDFDQASGLMSAREGGVGGGTGLINSQVAWDLNGNLTQRQDLKLSPTQTEDFFYDSLNRLDRSNRNGAQNLDVTLDAIGNITSKGGLSYTYSGTQNGCSYYAHPQPRAVRKIGTATIYCYDANGNMTKRAGSTIGYTSYNLPNVINSGSNASTISYGAYRNRYKQVAVNAGATETTIYVAGLLAKVTRGSLIEYRHTIPGGNGAAAIHTRRSGGTPASDTVYVHQDPLGSPELITNASGGVVVRLSFGAYGERRDGTDWEGPVSAANLTTIGNTSRQGFTGHEHLDAVSLIHMNGRVYEPVAGRFLSVDPIVQLGSSQSSNSYSYVWNNPLTLIDPSGFEPNSPSCSLFQEDPNGNCDFPDLNGSGQGGGSIGGTKGGGAHGHNPTSGVIWDGRFGGQSFGLLWVMFGVQIDLSQGEDGTVVVNSTFEALRHYFGGSGEPAALGSPVQDAIINSRDQQYRYERIRTGRTPNLNRGVYGVDVEFDGAFFIGETPIRYETLCRVGTCTTTFISTGDGFWDVVFDIDRIGPRGELPGGIPYPFLPFSWQRTFPDPRSTHN